MHDLIIANGRLLDGTGAPERRADVGIRGDRITDVGDLAAAGARETIDASGRLVCPGFIDVHSHSDAYLLIEPSAPSKTFQGITTEVVGNCGASAGPRFGACRMPSDWQAHTYPGTWSSVAEYRALLEAARPAPNVVLLVGHNTLRASIMGYDDRAASAAELAAMRRALERSLDEGGAGLSTGLVYAPGMFAPVEEIEALAHVVAARNGIYTSHMRSEGRRLLEAIDETLGIGRATGCRVQISHLKTAGPANWGLLDGALDRIRGARAAGLEVASDRYPYTASCTDLDVILPDWAAAGSRGDILARLRDPAQRARIRDGMLASRGDGDYWDRLTIGSTRHAANRGFAGRPIREVAAALGVEPVDAALHLMETDELSAGGIFHGMSEDNMWRILAEPWVMIGSDGSLRSPDGPLSHDHPHPRNYGTFPRFLRASLDGRTVPLPEAVRKMTSLPADQFRLTGRGRIARGQAADVVIIDPGSIRDRADYATPHRLSEGIETLIVNGTVTLRAGRLTGDRGGRFLDG
jgi:N-acyl-D-amino-acid deacylase